MSNQFVSGKLETLAKAQEKAEEAASVIQARFPGSYVEWVNKQTLKVFNASDAPIATIHLETIQ